MTLKEAIASLKKDAEHVALDTGEVELSDIAKRFIEAVELVTAAAESLRPGWTPCAEGMPRKETDNVLVCFLDKYGFMEVAIGWYWNSSGKWYTDDKPDPVDVLAWQPLPKPYNPDHIRDTTKKIDHIVDANKKIEQPYRADQKEDAEKKDSEPKKESHNPQECRNCTVDHDHHKSYLVCEKKHGGIDRDPSVCDGCADFKRR